MTAPFPISSWSYRQLGAWLKMQRNSVGCSQERMAEQLGVTFQMIQKWERAACRIPVDKLVGWCRVCGCNIQGAIAAAQTPEA